MSNAGEIAQRDEKENNAVVIVIAWLDWCRAKLVKATNYTSQNLYACMSTVVSNLKAAMYYTRGL